MIFEDLDFVLPTTAWGNKRAVATFPNGYGASVITGPTSYGGPDGLYELAVMHNGRLCYDTPITDDVLGYLKPEEVTEALSAIAALPAREAAQ